MIKQFKKDTKEVFIMVKDNSKWFDRIIIYILLIILMPLLFIIDLIRWILSSNK